jgi:5-methylcytosine-specific restriction endonuclease McrA
MTQTREQRRLIRLASAANTRAKGQGAHGEITAEDIARAYLASPQCAYCGVSLEPGHFSVDHELPFGRGGRNEANNIVVTCFTCNRRKHTKTPEEYAQHRNRIVHCIVCGKAYQPRWAEWQAGRARVCSRSCSAKLRWAHG